MTILKNVEIHRVSLFSYFPKVDHIKKMLLIKTAKFHQSSNNISLIFSENIHTLLLFYISLIDNEIVLKISIYH